MGFVTDPPLYTVYEPVVRSALLKRSVAELYVRGILKVKMAEPEEFVMASI